MSKGSNRITVQLHDTVMAPSLAIITIIAHGHGQLVVEFMLACCCVCSDVLGAVNLYGCVNQF